MSKREINILNLYACLGGNRYKWDELTENSDAKINVTAVELDPHLAELYKQRFPNDNVIVAGSARLSGNEKQYVVKFGSDGNVLWSNTSTENGVLNDVVAISQDVTAVTGRGDGELEWSFYVGLYDESGTEFKRLLGGNVTLAQVFISHGLAVDNNGDIVVSGFRNYYYYQYYMYLMKFHQ